MITYMAVHCVKCSSFFKGNVQNMWDIPYCQTQFLNILIFYTLTYFLDFLYVLSVQVMPIVNRFLGLLCACLSLHNV